MSTDRLFNGLALGPDTSAPVMVAVSGGSDSMALLLLANIWAQKQDVVLQAVTIDHGLRPEAAAEAAFVASVCAGLGIDHVTLAWEGVKPSFGIQEAARRSRYSLMDDFAHEIGANIILTGHTSDDQIETVLMRALRSGGEGDGRGFSGMAKSTRLYGGRTIFRPLLDVDRQTLRAYLADVPQSWIEDPSNLDRSFERVRVRAYLADHPTEVERIDRYANVCARFRALQAKEVAQFLERKCQILPGPVYHLPLKTDFAMDSPIFEQAVQTVLAMAGGQVHFVSRKRLEPVFALIADMLTSSSKTKTARLTMGGAVIEATKAGLTMFRETRNLSSVLLEPGESAIWDGRMHIYNGTDLPIFIEPASRAQIREFEAVRGEAYSLPKRAALWSTPIVHVQNAEGTTSPNLPLVEGGKLPKGLEIRLASLAIEHFCPEFDEPLRLWLRSLDRYTAASLQP